MPETGLRRKAAPKGHRGRTEGRKGLVLTGKDKLIHYYKTFGFVSEGISESVHGNAVWYQMRLTF